MPQPRINEDEIAALLAIPDPLERAAQITDYGRARGNLPPVLAKQRAEDVHAHRSRLSASQLAKRIKVARSGIFRIVRHVNPATQEA